MHSTASTAEPLLEMIEIKKSFPGVRALHEVNLTLGQGEVLALLGENGAGKSTLIKILGGAHQPDSGKLRIAGRDVVIATPRDAMQAGIGIIYQELNLVPGLTAWENIFLGRERETAGFIHRAEERARAIELFKQIGVDVPVDLPCGQLSIAQQQIVEIAKTIAQEVRIIIMDEPSAALTPPEVGSLFDIIRDLKALGIGVIYISHRLEEISEIADRVFFLRDGEFAGEALIGDLSRQEMIEKMVGLSIEDEFPKRSHLLGETLLKVQGLKHKDKVRDVSFEVRRGEVLGVTGLVGSGRSEMARLVFGADGLEAGTIELDGRRLGIRNPRDAIRAGICLLTEDRKGQGLILKLGVRENFGLPNLGEMSAGGFVCRRQESESLSSFRSSLRINTPHEDHLVCNLSGGNQQKVVLAKWLAHHAEVLIFDEPTRGIDVLAKYEIYLLINKLASEGKAVIMISSELPEVLGMSDRILVMHEGKLVGEIDDVDAATQEQVMQLAIG